MPILIQLLFIFDEMKIRISKINLHREGFYFSDQYVIENISGFLINVQ